jgi:hypothetical protein
VNHPATVCVANCADDFSNQANPGRDVEPLIGRVSGDRPCVRDELHREPGRLPATDRDGPGSENPCDPGVLKLSGDLDFSLEPPPHSRACESTSKHLDRDHAVGAPLSSLEHHAGPPGTDEPDQFEVPHPAADQAVDPALRRLAGRRGFLHDRRLDELEDLEHFIPDRILIRRVHHVGCAIRTRKEGRSVEELANSSAASRCGVSVRMLDRSRIACVDAHDSSESASRRCRKAFANVQSRRT